MSDESWSPVPGHNCEIAADGRCRLARATRHRQAGAPLTQTIDGLGAAVVLVPTVGHGGRSQPVRLARLMLLAYAGPPPTPRARIAYIDGDDTNTSASNLEWASPKTTGSPANSKPAPSRRGGRERKCMTCRTMFWSQHAGNRLCDPCRNSADDYMIVGFSPAVGLRR